LIYPLHFVKMNLEISGRDRGKQAEATQPAECVCWLQTQSPETVKIKKKNIKYQEMNHHGRL